MDNLGIIFVDSELIILHNQGLKLNLSKKDFIDMCRGARPDKYGFDKTIGADFLQVLKSNSIYCEGLQLQFDFVVKETRSKNDWNRWPFVTIRLLKDRKVELKYWIHD